MTKRFVVAITKLIKVSEFDQIGDALGFMKDVNTAKYDEPNTVEISVGVYDTDESKYTHGEIVTQKRLQEYRLSEL